MNAPTGKNKGLARVLLIGNYGLEKACLVCLSRLFSVTFDSLLWGRRKTETLQLWNFSLFLSLSVREFPAWVGPRHGEIY